MRIRTIKPEFWTSEDVQSCPDDVQLLAIGLLNYADDEGYFNANPQLIKGAIAPIRKTRDIEKMLIELEKSGYLELYTGKDGRQYGFIINFTEHQYVKRVKPSKIKNVERVCPIGGTSGEHRGNSGGPEWNGTGNGMERNICASDDARGEESEPSQELMFNSFWNQYPRKQHKKKAREYWDRIQPDPETARKMITHIRAMIRTEQWTKDGGQFIPLPGSYLNGEFWNDELPSPKVYLGPTGELDDEYRKISDPNEIIKQAEAAGIDLSTPESTEWEKQHG